MLIVLLAAPSHCAVVVTMASVAQFLHFLGMLAVGSSRSVTSRLIVLESLATVLG